MTLRKRYSHLLNIIFITEVTSNPVFPSWRLETVIESANHQSVYLGSDLKGYVVPSPIPLAGTPLLGLVCSKPHPIWP